MQTSTPRMENMQVLPSPADTWESQKDLIGWLYQQMTLPRVKAYMEETGFSTHSLSLWKKKIHGWGFDRKNNRASDMALAASHFQQQSLAGTLEPYVLPNGRIITADQYHKYAKRSKKVIPAGSPTRGSPDNQASISIQRHQNDMSTAVSRKTIHPGRIASAGPAYTDPRLRRKRLVALRKLRFTYLFGQGYVRPGDLMTPRTTRTQESSLKALQRCIEISWELKTWSVDEDGYYTNNPAHSKTQRPEIGLYDLIELYSAYERGGNIVQARKASLIAAEVLQFETQRCFPGAMQRILIWLGNTEARGLSTPMRKLLIRYCQVFGSLDATHDAFSALFSTLKDIDSADVGMFSAKSLLLLSRCLNTINPRLHWEATSCHFDSILTNPTLTGSEMANKISATMSSTQLSERHTRLVRLKGNAALADCYLESGEAGKCIDTIIHTLPLLDDLETRNELDPIYAKNYRADLLESRAWAMWHLGDREGAIVDIQAIVAMFNSSGNRAAAVPYQESLMSFHREIGDLEQAHQIEIEYEKVLRDVNELTLIDFVYVSDELEMSREERLEDELLEQQKAIVPVGVDHDWKNYVEGRSYGQERTGSNNCEWREGVEMVVQEAMMFTEPWHRDGANGIAMIGAVSDV